MDDTVKIYEDKKLQQKEKRQKDEFDEKMAALEKGNNTYICVNRTWYSFGCFGICGIYISAINRGSSD